MCDGLFNKPKGTFIPRNEICDENVGRKREIVRCIFSWLRYNKSSFFFPLFSSLLFLFFSGTIPWTIKKKRKKWFTFTVNTIKISNSLTTRFWTNLRQKGVNESASTWREIKSLIFVRERIIQILRGRGSIDHLPSSLVSSNKFPAGEEK